MSKVYHAISNIRAEITPCVKYYKPANQPKSIGTPKGSVWQTRKVEIVKTPATGSTTLPISIGNIVTALGLGSANVDFFIEEISSWALSTAAGSSSLKIETPLGAVVKDLVLNRSDWGTPDQPASIGINVPRALANQYSNASPSSTTQVLAVNGRQGIDIVTHLWVVYRPSA